MDHLWVGNAKKIAMATLSSHLLLLFFIIIIFCPFDSMINNGGGKAIFHLKKTI